MSNVVLTADYPVTVLPEMMEAMVRISWKRYLKTMLTIFEMTLLRVLLMIVGPVPTEPCVLGKVIMVMVVLVAMSKELGTVKLAARLVAC